VGLFLIRFDILPMWRPWRHQSWGVGAVGMVTSGNWQLQGGQWDTFCSHWHAGLAGRGLWPSDPECWPEM